MAEFLPGDEDICFTCHLMQECTDAGKLPPCLGVIEPFQQPITNVKSSADATAEHISSLWNAWILETMPVPPAVFHANKFYEFAKKRLLT